MISVGGSEDSHGYIAKYSHPALGSTIADNQVILPELFPNPVHELITVRSSSSLTNIKVTDLSGKTVLRLNSIGGSILDVSSLSDGLYVLHFTMDGNEIVKRFIKL